MTVSHDGQTSPRSAVVGSPEVYRELARLGTATLHEASGGDGLVDAEWVQVLPGTRAAGPARIAYCGQGDNRGVHEIMARLCPGEVLVLTMPEPTPVALFGELLGVQARRRGAAAVLVDAAVRDTEELRALGLPTWARFVRVRGTKKARTLGIDVPVLVGGARIEPGDAVVLDADGVVVVAADRLSEVLVAAQARAAKEIRDRERFEAGESSWEIYGYGPQ